MSNSDKLDEILASGQEPTQHDFSQYTEDELQNTDVFRGFQSFIFAADIMQRYPFGLRETNGGRIFVDNNTCQKLRRRKVKGDKHQNAIFEVYKTIDNSNVVDASVTIGEGGFSPSLLLGAVAGHAHLSASGGHTRAAQLLIQAAAAILQDGERAAKAEAALIEANPEKADYYKAQSSVIARANTIMVLADVLNNTVVDNDTMTSGLAEDLEYLNEYRAKATDSDDKHEISATQNVLFGAITQFAYTPGVKDVLVMADEIKASVGAAALVELDDQEQK